MPDQATPMERALLAAKAAADRGEVPVGAVVVERETGTVIATGGNRVIEDRDPTAHAELLVIQAACRVKNSERLIGCDLYVTLEPCAMCAQAIAFARIDRLYFGASDPKGGGVEHGARIFAQPTCHHRPEIYGGLSEQASAQLLRGFFAERRPADKGTAQESAE
ncbi:MAG TPA: nucleoside deaminase [Alphaproteobacteria bacterium]|nr:nucleoside deaminase [Alphaproteobacteria bacterium]